jgi:hypothetical protein
LKDRHYYNELTSILTRSFTPTGYTLTKAIELDPIPESVKYNGLIFSLNEQKIIYRRGKITTNRPGAFLAIWRRPFPACTVSNKPIPFKSNELDYLFVQVEEELTTANGKILNSKPKSGFFIFPVSLLMKHGIVISEKAKGKTGFRVFPPWSQDRGDVGTKVFSASAKKTQRWQLPYFIEINDDGLIDSNQLNKIFEPNN